MLQGPQLVILNTAVIVHSVQLCVADAQDEIRGPTVAGTAFRAAWKTPGLLPDAARNAPILDAKLLFLTFRPYQHAIELGLVPSIGIAGPLPSLFQHNPRFDPLARRWIARFA